MIELTINGRAVGTEKGSTVLQAALNNGIKIPHLCYDKRVVPYGGCRLCIVEIEGQKKLEASCATLATEGLEVRTETPRVLKIRQTVLEMMLVHHPLDCPVCDKAGECDLQELVYQYGRPGGRFTREKKPAPPVTKGPLVELNSSRCVLCGKCVRLCGEYQGRGALGLIGRGFPTVVQPAFGEALECDHCGQCIDVCPTGALLNKSLKFGARSWSLEEKDTICPFCSCGCTLTLGISEGRILRSIGKQDRGVSEGNLCGRGRFGVDYIYSDNRIDSPMIRVRGELEPVSWDKALNFIGDRLKNIIAAHGPSSIGALGSPRCTNEDNYMLQKFMQKVIGSHNIDSSAAFGYGIAEKAWNRAFGMSGHRIDLKAPLVKELILVIESDPGITHPVFGLNILQATRQGSKLIVVDSRKSKLSRHSNRWAKLKPGTAVAFLNGIMKIMIDNDLIDSQSARKIKGFSALEESLKDSTPGKVAAITGIAAEELIAISEALAEAKTRMLTLSIGVSENTKGLDTVLAAANLINLLGESSEALQIPAEHANTFGLYQMGIRPDGGPGYQKSEAAGKGAQEMLYEPRSLRALYIMGADPVVNFPEALQIRAVLKSLNLLIVQDMALTETAKLADVVLPAAGWAEKDGAFINAEGVAQRVSKAVGPAGRSFPDWQILRELATIMGKDMGIVGREDISKEIDSLPAAPLDAVPASRAFNPVHYEGGETADDSYPLNMVLRDLSSHSGSMSTRSKSLGLVASEALLEINDNDAERFGISDNGHVRVTSRRGTAYLRASVSGDVPDGIVYVPAHFSHSGVSAITRLPGNGGIHMDAVRVETS